MSKTYNIGVRAHKKESPEKLIRRFRRKVKKLGIIDEFRKRQRFKKPSEKRREKISRRQRELARKKK